METWVHCCKLRGVPLELQCTCIWKESIKESEYTFQTEHRDNTMEASIVQYPIWILNLPGMITVV